MSVSEINLKNVRSVIMILTEIQVIKKIQVFCALTNSLSYGNIWKTDF